MAKIIWKGITKDFKGISMGELKNENAIKLEVSSQFLEVGYILFILLGSAICTGALMLKRYFTGIFPISPILIPVGLIIGLLLIIAHEYIHAIVYPKNAVVEVGVIPRKFFAYAISCDPISKSRFIVMSLLPVILGIIPLVLFCVFPVSWIKINTILWACSLMGLISPYPDYMNVINVVKQVPKGAMIRFYKFNFYWFNN